MASPGGSWREPFGFLEPRAPSRPQHGDENSSSFPLSFTHDDLNGNKTFWKSVRKARNQEKNTFTNIKDAIGRECEKVMKMMMVDDNEDDR